MTRFNFYFFAISLLLIYNKSKVFGQSENKGMLEMGNKMQLTPYSCWAASIEMVVEYLKPEFDIKQLNLIKKMSPNCDIRNNIRFVGNQAFIDENCDKCMCTLPAPSLATYEEDLDKDMGIIDSILKIYKCKSIMYKDSSHKLLPIIKEAILNKWPIISLDSRSVHIVVIYGFDFDNKSHLYLHDPRGKQKRNFWTRKFYWKTYDAIVDITKKEFNNLMYDPAKKNMETYKLSRFLVVKPNFK